MLSGGSAERNISYSVIVETAWLLLCAAFAAASVFPLKSFIAHDFIIINATLAFLFALYFRFVLFFRQIVYLKFLATQIPLFIFNPILFIKTLSKMQEMLYLFDTHDLYFFLAAGAKDSIYRMSDAYHFLRNEFILFSVGLLLLIVLSELRVLLAFVKRVREME